MGGYEVGYSSRGMGGIDRTDVAQDRGGWRPVVNAVMNLGVP